MAILNTLPLISAKPIVYVCNTDADKVTSGNHLTEQFLKYIKKTEPQNEVITLSAQLETDAA